jgi:hypothetical protein
VERPVLVFSDIETGIGVRDVVDQASDAVGASNQAAECASEATTRQRSWKESVACSNAGSRRST